MQCSICYGLSLQRLSGTSAVTTTPTHDFWVLLRSLGQIKSAADAGCDICYVITTGLLSLLGDSADLGINDLRVDIRIPPARHNRVRAIAYRENGSSPLLDLEFFPRVDVSRTGLGDAQLVAGKPAGTPWNNYGSGRSVDAEGDLGSICATIQKWISNCSQGHDECAVLVKQLPHDLLPTRVIDVKASDSAIQVVASDNLQGRYIAFSHCWGTGTLPTTTRPGLPQTHGLESLESSFQDVVKLSRALDVPYLWIDSLCIIQGDPEDWEIESSKMLQYYSGAFVVIAANRARNPSEGFLGPREKCFTAKARSREGQDVVFRRFTPHLAADQGSSSSAPLDRRAWALQERLGARRIVHFYQDEMIWECESAVSCECGKLTGASQGSSGNQRLEDNSLPLRSTMSFTSIGGAPQSQLFQKWSMLVERYTDCGLSRDEDRLPAIGGLARLFTRAGLRLYRAGMWEEIILPSLLWRAKAPLDAQRPLSYTAPSWSWASLVGPVSWILCTSYRLAPIAIPLACVTTPSKLDPYGKVSGGSLRIQSYSWETELEYQPATGFKSLACGESAFFDINSAAPASSFYQYQQIKCILIAEGSSRGEAVTTLLCLIVSKVDGDDESPRYGRIGLAALDHRRRAAFSRETIEMI